MIDLKSLVKEVGNDFRISPSEEGGNRPEDRLPDEIFHLPMISFILLMVANNKKRDLKVENSTGWIVDIMMELHANFVFSEQRLRLSSRLRSKVVEGILFLESADLVIVSEGSKKSIQLTTKGKKFLKDCSVKHGVSSELLKRTRSAVGRASVKGSVLL